MLKKNHMSIATLMGLAFGLVGDMRNELGLGRPRLPKARHWHKPHQGAREMARRRSGQDWLDFKAGDRVRRGLPALQA